jgi:predicted phage tail protein
MQRVILLDELGEKFGAMHEYEGLRTPVDAIRLLCLNYPEFCKELLESKENNVGYKVIQSETEFTLDDMLLPFGSKDLIIVPVIAGSGDGFDQVLMGAALIGLSYFTLGGATMFTSGGAGIIGVGSEAIVSGMTASAIAIGGNVGIAMTLGGINQLLSPQNITDLPGMARDSGPESLIRGADGRQSYAYTGAVNSVGVGATIPVCFGKALIGSHVISADVEVADESDPLNEWIGVPSEDTIRVQGQELDTSWNSTSGIQSRRYSSNNQLGGYWVLLNQSAAQAQPQTVNITQTGRQVYYFFNSENRGSTSYKYFMCAFALSNGLYSFVGDENSTKVEGYIHFEIIIRSREGDRDVNSIPVTVQGLMSGSQEYK